MQVMMMKRFNSIIGDSNYLQTFPHATKKIVESIMIRQ